MSCWLICLSIGSSLSRLEDDRKCGGNSLPMWQQWKTAGLGFVIQKFFSALISIMDVPHVPHVLAYIFVLLFASELTQGFPVEASKGGNRSVFFCKAQGCAAHVTHVLCKDKNLPIHTPIPNCTGPPPPNTVCQYDGRAFVSIISDGNCDFERDDYIDTEKCTDQNDMCAFRGLVFPPATTTSPVTEDNANHGLSVGLSIGGCVIVLSALGVLWYFYKRRQNREQEQASDPVGTEPLRERQSPGETSERDAHDGAPGLDDGSSPSQPNHRA